MFDAPRLTVALTFDHDAISDSVRRGDPPVKLSHAEFGPRVGLPRILALLARDGIPATFFVPGHSLVTFPENTDAILEGGHELACHGWYHEDVTELTPGEEAEILGRSIEAVADRTGAPPAGYRAPYWALSPATLGLVEAAGFRYDSSLMADDYRLFRVRHGDRHSMGEGTVWGERGELVEVPVYWTLDDWPLFEPSGGRDGLRPPSEVLEIWLAELNYAYGHTEGGVLTITMHPECIGRGHRMAMLETFIEQARALPGVEFERLDTVVARWSAADRPADRELRLNAR
jgi:peptidoglycan/xylan/chitin deacetylase (PgdA/CDA1 family)